MKTVSRISMIALMLIGLSFAQEPPKEIPKLPDNAALQYWFAFYFMYEESKGIEPRVPDEQAWPKRLGELYPRYIKDPKVFFVTPGDVPKGILPHQIDQETHFRYMPSALRRRGRGGSATMCVLRTKEDRYFGEVRGYIEGYADGHVEWKPRKRGEARPDNATFGMNNAKQILLALHRFQDDQPAEKKSRSASEFVYGYLNAGTVPVSEARRSGIREICEKNKQAVTEYLRKGAEMKRCDFGLDYSRGLFLLLPHLAKARKLARNAIAYGKLLEAERMPLEAAQVYCDVLNMGQHVAQDQLLVSGLVGCAVGKMACNALRHLVAHEPAADVCELILARLSALPDPYIELGSRFRMEAKLVKPMLFAAFAKEPNLYLTEKDREYIRDLILRTAKSTGYPLAPDDETKMKKLLTVCYKEYLDRIETAAEIMGEPYPSAAPTLREMTKEIETSSNPILKALMPNAASMSAAQVKAQMQVRVTKLLAAAALHRAKTRKYPKTLDELKPYFPEGIPQDPTSGKEFTYRLDSGRPCVESTAPPPGAKAGDVCVFGFAKIRNKERTGKRWTGR